MRIKMENFLSIVVGLIPAIYFGIYISRKFSYGMYIPIIIIFILCIVKDFFKNYPRMYAYFIGFAIVAFLGCTCLSGGLSLYGFLYIILLIVFFIILPILGNILSSNKKRNLLIMAISGAFFLIPNILKEIGNISENQVKSALGITEGFVRYRIKYGFPHANTAGFSIVSEIIILYVLSLQIENKKIKGLVFFIAAFLFYSLLGTGSRTAILCCSFFFLVDIVQRIVNKFHRLSFFLYPFLCIMLLYIVFTMNVSSDDVIANSSGRFDSMVIIINALKESNKLFFGVGEAGISSGYIESVLQEHVYIDNWYLHILASLGIIGSSILLIGIVLLIFYIFKNTEIENRSIQISLILCIFLYGITENVVFVPGVSLSVIVWTIIFSMVSK